MKLNALLVDPAVLGPVAWHFLERVCGTIPGLGVDRLHPGLHGRPACPRASPWRRRLDRQAVPPGGGRLRGSRPLSAAIAAVRHARTAGPLVVGELEISPDRFQAYVSWREPGLDPSRVRAPGSARRARRKGARARRDLPAGLGLLDDSRRSLRGRLRAQASFEASEALPGVGVIHTHFGIGYRFDPQPVAPGADLAPGKRSTAAEAPETPGVGALDRAAPRR